MRCNGSKGNRPTTCLAKLYENLILSSTVIISLRTLSASFHIILENYFVSSTRVQYRHDNAAVQNYCMECFDFEIIRTASK